MSNSQNDEEEKILEHFYRFGGGVARFLDIGAHDGKVLSNTWRLAELGWSGTLVEPSPAAFCGLMLNYKNRTDVNLVNTAIVSSGSGLVRFGDSNGDFVSTLDASHRALWSASGVDHRPGVVFQDIYVSATTFDTLFTLFPGPYPFVNLDVEGINFDLFNSLLAYGLDKLGVDLLCVEYQNKFDEIAALADKAGYDRYHKTSENLILAKRRATEVAK